MAPVAHNDQATTDQGAAVTIDVLANDTDANGQDDLDPASVTTANVANGTTTVDKATGAVTFTPAAGFNGNTQFDYTVADRAGATSTANVRVTVNPVSHPNNHAPVAHTVNANGTEDTVLHGQLAANDPDGDALTYAVGSAPAHGTVTVDTATGQFTLTPEANFAGNDVFTFTASDGQLTSAPADAKVSFAAVNDAPAIAPIADQSTDEDAALAPVSFTVSDVDNNPAQLTVTAASSNQALVPNSSLALGGSGSDRTIAATPAKDQNGTTTITLTVSDGSASSSRSFTLTVKAVNDAPVAQDGSASGTEDQPISGALHASDIDSTTLTYAVVAQPAHGAVAVNADGSFTYTPAQHFSGTDSFTFKANDGAADSNVATVTLTLAHVNHAPVASDLSVSGDEGTTISGQVHATDADSDTLSYAKASDPAHGTVGFQADGSFAYTPALNFAGTDSFTFRANDGTADSAPATVSITVADKPEARLDVAGSSAGEGDGAVTFTVSLSRAPDGPVTVSYQTADGTAKAGSDYTETHGTLDFTPGGPTQQTVSVPVTDDAASEGTETFTLTVAATAGADSVDSSGTLTATGTITDNDVANTTLLRVGAAKHTIQPTQEEIDGIVEDRLGGAEGAPSQHLQKFNLGGFGINPMSNIPDDPAGLVQTGNESLTDPASRRVFRDAKGVDEEEMARAFVIEQPNGARVVFVMFDAVGAGNIIEKNMTAAIVAGTQTCGATHDQACFTPENVVIGMTHSHTASDLQGLWGGVPQKWINQQLYPGAVAAVTDALASMRPAHLRVAQGMNNDYNSYRRPRIDPNADADGHVTLLSAVAEDGTTIGSILQYAAHPTGIGSGNKPRTPHPDFILGATDWLEGHLGGTALYYNGPIADASGSGSRPGCDTNQEYKASDPSAAGFGYVRCRGEGIADAALGFYAHSRELQPTLEARHVNVMLPVTNPGFIAFGLTGSFNRYYDFAELPTESIPGIGPEKENLPQLTPTAQTEVSRITIGGADSGLEIVTIPGEGTNTFGEYIRGLAKTDTMLLGLTHNSFGYIVPEDEFSYVDQEGDDGLVAPFTGYEENVSLGPLTAPILRSQAYNVLFDAGPEKEVPPTVSVCLTDSTSPACVTRMLQNRVARFVDGVAACVQRGITADGCPLNTALGYLDPLWDGLTQVSEQCTSFGGPEELCSVFNVARTGVGQLPVTVAGVDTILAPEIAKTAAMGCDFLDTSECHFPFPNDFFTTAAAPGSPQSAENGGTGKRVNFNILGMPRNSAGKPVDPTEWNRNDGFSPGQMVLTYVPGLKANADGTIPGAAPITDVAQSNNADAPIFVIDADTGERWPIWAEADLNANLLEHGKVVETDQDFGDQSRPLGDGRVALIVRPARNFAEGHRYIVALRNLKDAFGKTIKASLGFQACTGQVPSLLRTQSPMKDRCDHINELIDTLAHFEDGFRARDLYLTWDFTVASAKNDVGRLAHMRDVAFNSLATVPGTDCTQLTAANVAQCSAPTFAVDTITENPQDGIARRVEGTLTVPSFVTPVEPTPGQESQASAAVKAICNGVPQADFTGGCNDGYDLAGGATLPPNRLFYSPADGDSAAAAADPSQAPYGDGLPDTVGNMQTRFICQIPQKAFTEPARASIYGHGLLDSRMAVTYEGSPQMEAEHNFMYCAVDLFGFATGDLGNVASTLVDVSNFPVVPDGSQQGLLNYMFLARAMRDPKGFAANAAFQNAGKPLFDTREIFYNGNSQGGIVGGVVLAISKDVNRGVLGSLGMNYSTLLQRSKDFDPYSVPLYTAYTDPLDRMFLFSMMQMLWDRSENDGYAEHLTQKSAVEGGPVDHVLLNTMYGDQQVTMWSAQNMARTMGIPGDYAMVGRAHVVGGTAPKRHPDLDPAYGQGPVVYGTQEDDAQYSDASSALVMYAANETDDHTPIGNVPHRDGPDPHDNSHRRHEGRCQISHWLQRDGRLLNINTDRFSPETGDHEVDCPAVRDNSGAPDALSVPPPAGGSLGQVYDQLIAAINSVLAPAGQALADAISDGATQLGQAVGIYEPAPGPGTVDDPAPQPLVAGAAKGLIRVPVGTPLGGYLRPPVGGEYVGEDPQGELTDNIPNDGCDPSNPPSCIPNVPLPDELRKVTSPYATYSPPSRGYYDSLTAKAVAMYDGHDYVVLVKTDFIGMLDEVVQDVKARVKADKNIDLGSGLIMSATHTHDGPGALANNSTRYFWLAMDVYQHDVYLRVVGDLAAVVENALAQMKPAKIGHATGLDQLGMNHYRRGRFAYYKDNDAPNCNWTEAQADCNARDGDDQNGVPTDANELRRRIGVLELQDAATSLPLALVVNFQAHGIAFDVENQYFSGDVLASLEREVEQGYKAEDGAGTPITMFVQGTNGDVTPSADYSIRGIEQWGKKIAPEIRAIADRVGNFDDKPNLRTVSQRIVLNRHTLGYKDGEYPYPYGAAQCGNDVAVPYVDIATGALHDATGLPEVPTDAKDIPGWEEAGLPTIMPYCIPATAPDTPDLADNGVAENGAFVPGDTILSAVKIGGITLIANPGEPLTEYGVRMLEMAEGEGYNPHDTFIWGYTGDHVGYILPPVEADWATFGGAESTTTFWGWKQGERFINVQKTLLDALRDGTAAPADEFKIDYSKYRAIYDAKPPVPPTPSVLPGSVMAQPANIERFGKTTFQFEGGDPVVDFPRVTMEHADGTPVLRANGEVMDSEFEMHLKYRFTTGRHLWTVEFESPRDWVAGGYKFHVEGIANQGVDAPYALDSKVFTVSPTPDLQLSNAACNGGVCSADLKYKAYPSNYRIVDYRVSAKNQAPVRGGTVTFANGTQTVEATTDDNGHATAQLDGAVNVTGRDIWGNTAPQVTAQQPSGPDSDGDGVPDASDQCPNTPAGTPVDANGCPTQSGGGGFPLCDPAFGTGYCITDVPVIGGPIQDAVNTVYNAVTGGGGVPPPPSGLPDQCDPTGQLPDGERCLSDVPGVGGMFGDGGNTGGGGETENASCVAGKHLDGGRSYQVKIPSDSGETISFQVLEPTHFDCANADDGAHPLILQGHGFGGSRSTSGFTNFRDAGYTVISFDQRGHGDSTGTIRVLDPDVEGKDLVKILDWAEANLDYLAYRDESKNNPKFVARPANGTSVAGGVNLLVGSIGGSYGGGYQTLLHAVDTKNRLDAMAPDITWHDLRWSLNPGDVLKSGWDLLLVAGGDAGSYGPGLQNQEDPTHRGLDPYLDEVLAQGVATGEFPREALDWFHYHSPAYWCGLNGEPTMDIGYDASAHQPVDPNMMALQAQNPVGTNKRKGQPAVNVLFSQGFRDTLFNFNDAWANYQCFKARAGDQADVRLITHESGHIFGDLVPVPTPGPLDFENTAGTSGNNCGQRNYKDAQFGWFEQKLRGAPESPALLGTQDSLCVSLTSNESVDIPAAKMFAPGSGVPAGSYYAVGDLSKQDLSAQNIPEGTAAQALHMAGQDQNAILPLLTVTDANGLIVAGIAQVDLQVTSPQMANDAVCDAAGPAPTLRTGCDSIVYLSLAKKGAADGDWTIIDDQSTPVRGLGSHTSVNLIGVAERLQAGDQLALMVRGYSPQYLGSYTRDATLPVVNVTASVRLPLYAVDAGGQPRFDVTAAGSVSAPSTGGGGDTGSTGGGVLGLLGDFTNHVQSAITALLSGDNQGAQDQVAAAATGAADDAQHLGDDPSPEGVIGEDEDLQSAATRATSANRDAQAVVITGSQIPDWSVPEARGVPNPYPSGSGLGSQCSDNGAPDQFCDPIKNAPVPGGVQTRSAHNGTLVYPVPGAPKVEGVPVNQIAAYAYKDGAWTEIPVQVDERMPYFLANANSDFGFYSGTDQELTYVWDTESWGMTAGTCSREYDTTGHQHFDQNGHDITGLSGPTPDPVQGLDNDDEIAFMAADAGELATGTPADVPAGAKGEQVAIADPLDPSKQRFVYLFLKSEGSKFRGQSHYVHYQRDANADQWVDRSFFEGTDPFHRTDVGTSNTGYGPNLGGTVCTDGTPDSAKASRDRFPRDGVTVSTDAYQWRATGRWLVREMHVAKPGQPGVYGPDLIDRWKGRAFQQSPDTNVSVVGFEDEQVNWEANSAVLGERSGPVRAIREIWGADSGTNVTKTETFYRDAVAYRYHVRVHPIPSDGLYTSWDYNRGAMIPADGEVGADGKPVPGGRYYTVLRPRGVPVDGVNDDIGNVDGTTPIPGIGPNGGPGCISPDDSGIVSPNGFGRCPVYFDAADPTFNLMMSFDNWEQVSGKGNLGSLVYTFENKGNTSYGNPLVVPYYRDDACLDDGTGDDPVARPYPGERSDDSRVIAGYQAANGGMPYDQIPCSRKQGAYAAHGVHYFFTGDTDNAFSPVTTTEIDGQQWQFAVPTEKPKNVAEPYANTVRVPLQVVVTPVASGAPSAPGGASDGVTAEVVFQNEIPASPSAQVIDGQSFGATATVFQRQGDGTYVPAPGRLVTLVMEVDCGGQQDPTGQFPCNAGADHIARSAPQTTDASGQVTLSIGWEADAWGSGMSSLFGGPGNTPVHVMLVDNGADFANVTDNRVMNYSPAGQELVVQKNYAEGDQADDQLWVPVMLSKGSQAGGSGGGDGQALAERGFTQVFSDFTNSVVAAIDGPMADAARSLLNAVNTFVKGVMGILVDNEHGSALAVLTDVVDSPGDAGQDLQDGDKATLLGYFTGPGSGHVRAGVGVVDMTPDVGYCAGQYCDYNTVTDYGIDPYATAKTKKKSYGVQSRETTRAIVVEGSNGKRIALLKTDNYLAQDNLLRRVGQLLDADGTSGISYSQILYGVTHDHSATYNSTLAFGPMLFEDAYDARAFENQARKMALAIEIAAAGHATDVAGARGSGLKDARMGATVAYHSIYKGNVVGLNTADDGTPAGYPYEYNDHQVTVMRFDAADGSGPIATWINWGQHGEGNDGYDLHSADFVAALERMVERDTGAPMVYSQGDVGSSENSANHSEMIADDHSVCGHWFEGAAAPSDDRCKAGEGTVRDFDHRAYAANERNVRFLADDIRDAWTQIGANEASVIVPMSTDFPVDFVNNWVPGPLSHPYPSVSNCRAAPTVDGDAGAPVLGLPDCARADDGFAGPGTIDGVAGTPFQDAYQQAYQAFRQNGGDQAFGELAMLVGTMRAEGVPVPDHYDATGFEGVEENHRIKLQAFRLGDVLLASCACEAQDDLILNLKSRTDTTAGNIYDGFDWACVMPGYADDPQYAAACETQKRYFDPSQPILDRGGYFRGVPSSHVLTKGNAADDALVAHMRAQLHNDARGWDLPENAVAANSEPLDNTKIWGNFTKEEVQDFKRADGSRVPGFKLPVGVGHAGDYNGYTVSYREYMNRDSYRKALTTYGPHTADYMVTRLVRMAAQLQGGPAIQPEPLDTFAQADEARQVATSLAHGAATAKAYEAYYAALPADAGTPVAVAQPADIGYYNAATFTWRGGSTAVDNPLAHVEYCAGGSSRSCDDGQWQRYADGSGEVQTRVFWPQSPDEVAAAEAGQFAWKWAANFEAFQGFPTRLGATPPGFYRFVVDGCINTDPASGATDILGRLQDGFLAGAASNATCKAGAGYTLTSDVFEVQDKADVVRSVTMDGAGKLSIGASSIAIPRTYASLFPFIGDNGSRRVCDGCSFRPWARSDAPISSVKVKTDRGEVQATFSAGGRWLADTALADGDSATITVRYNDGSVGREVSFTRTAATALDSDRDGINDSADACPTQAGTGSDGCPADSGGSTSDAPQLCMPDQSPVVPGECLADNGGGAIQDAVNTVYDTVTGVLPLAAPATAPSAPVGIRH